MCLNASLAEEQVFRQHLGVLVWLVDPVKPRKLQIIEQPHSDERTAHTAAVYPDFLFAFRLHSFQFLRRVLRLKRIAPVRKVVFVRVQIPAHVVPAGILVLLTAMCVVPQTDIHSVFQEKPKRILRKYNVVIDHQHIIVLFPNRQLCDLVSGRGAIISSNISEVGDISALVQIPDRLIGIREDRLKRRNRDQDSEVFAFLVRVVFFGAGFGSEYASPLQANASSHVMFLYFV